jgi:8-oxo-dGTP pyrophosphatase MutT (NUDIX family)
MQDNAQPTSKSLRYLFYLPHCSILLQVFLYVTIQIMSTWKILELISSLRERLEPVDQATTLIDELEGERPHAKKSAILVPIFVHDGALSLIFIRRASTLRTHSGEIAFPGGKVDPEDHSPKMTALREAEEELGIAPERIEVLGVLKPVFTVVSNYLITPVVGYLPQGPGTLKIQPDEVAELIIIPLQSLQDPAIFHTEQWTRAAVSRTIYFYDYGSYRIWGATGRILHALLQRLPTK